MAVQLYGVQQPLIALAIPRVAGVMRGRAMGKIWSAPMSGNWDQINRATKLAHLKPASKAKRRKQCNRIFREVAERSAKGLEVPAEAIEYVQARAAQGPWLIRNRGAAVKAHIWTGTDTACHMASTGGLKMSKYSIRHNRGSHGICRMCRIVAKRGQ